MKTKQLIKEMNQHSKKLSEDHKALFDKILLKIRFSNISEKEAEEFSYHCLNLLLQAEQENLEVEAVLGTNNVDLFCDEYIKEVRNGYGVLKKIYIKIRYLPLILLIFEGFWEMLISLLIPTWLKQKSFTLDVTVTLAMIVGIIFVVGVLSISLHYMSRISWDLNHGSKKEDHKWTFIIFLGSFVTLGFFVVIKLYLTQELFHINYLVFMIVCTALYLIQSGVENKLS